MSEKLFQTPQALRVTESMDLNLVSPVAKPVRLDFSLDLSCCNRGDTCAVCLSPFKNESTLKMTKCLVRS